MSSLTHGAVRTLVASEGHSSDPGFQPAVQLIQVKPVGGGGGGGAGERFRAIISDGEHYVQGMLATQLNHLVHSEQVQVNSIVKVEDYMNNLVQGRTVIILLKIAVLTANPGQRFGDPKDIEKAGGRGGTSNTAPQAAQPMYGQRNNQGGGSAGGGGGMYNRQPVANNYGAGGSGNNPYNQSTSPSNNRFGGQSASAPIVRSSGAGTSASGQPITPIAQLNMYQNRWTIRGRLTSKSDIRTWNNARGEGSLFSVEILDGTGMDIRATFFKEAVDKFYNMLECDKVYTFSGGRLKVANMQYNTCKSNFEITFDQNAEIHLDNDRGDIQHMNFDFVKIAQLESVEPGKNVDVLAVVKSVGQIGTIVSKKTGSELTKCELVLADDSNAEVNLTVWGDKANSASSDYADCPVVAFRRVRVSDFGGRSLSANMAGMVNPRVPDTERLRAWWRNGGSNAAGSRSLSSSGMGGGRMEPFEDRKTISSIKTENMGYNDKPDWLSFKATFNFIKKDKDGGAWYTACSNSDEPCKNRFKVSQTTDGNWFCDKCQQTSPTCVRRFIFSATLIDDTCTSWVSVFNEQAETLLGVTADEVYAKTMDENYDQEAYDAYFAKANFTDWIFKCKVKQEMYGDESRVKATIYSLNPIDYVKESRDLLNAIAKF